VLLDLRTDKQSPEVISSLEVSRADGSRFKIKARIVVLAAGGLENTRILLLNEATRNGGPAINMIWWAMFHGSSLHRHGDDQAILEWCLRPRRVLRPAPSGWRADHGQLRLSEAVMRREKLLNACAVIVPHFRNLRSNLPSVVKQIARKGPRFWRTASCRSRIQSAAGKPRCGTFSPSALLEGYYSERFCGWSRVKSKEQHFGQIGVRSLVEQSPDLANRIVLDDQLDALGQRRLKLFWRWNELDLRSIRRTQEIFRQEFAAAGIGTFTPTEEFSAGQPRTFFSPHHFMGTTRMHEDPNQGVVDANCRVHGLQNLFVTGSSVSRPVALPTRR